MKKTLLASAIAAATFSGSVAAMTAEDLAMKMDSMPQIYGNLQMVYTYEDSDATGDTNGLSDNGSTIGVQHEHEIAPGITGFGKIELEGIETTEKGAGNGLTALDEAYIGIKGDSFGQVWVGSDDSRYEALLGDYGNWIYEKATLNPGASFTTGEDDQIQYISPSFGGLTLHAGIQINGEAEGTKSYPYQLAASYSMDTLTASLVMDSNDGDTGDGSNENSYGLALEYGLGDLVLDAYFDMRSGEEGTANAGNEQMGYMATYNMGANTFRLSYELADADIGDASTDVIMFQALHNVSDHMYVYVEGGQQNVDSGTAEVETNQINLGGVYYF